MKHITTHCPLCHATKDFDLDLDAWIKWQGGQRIQRAFPPLTADDRERLISGTCPSCWDRMFGEDEDEDEIGAPA